ncbi:unnamed protein product [Alopecurus aequalis]
MESRPATMAKAVRATPRGGSSLPEEIAIWEILVRLSPKSLLRCRAVSRAWCRATSTRDFLLAHHARQPSLPIVSGELVSGCDCCGDLYEDLLAFDDRAADAQLQPEARLDGSFNVDACCDGLLVLSKRGTIGITYLSICNPVTREHAPIGEYRLLLHPRTQIGTSLLPKHKVGCYVLALGSDQPPRYIEGPEAASGLHCSTVARVRDSLHWFPVSESRLVLVFDTTTESFRLMGAPVVPTMSCIVEMDDTLAIYSYHDAEKVVEIWVLQDYESEVWAYKYNVKLPTAEIRAKFGGRTDNLYRSIMSVDGDVLLLLSHGGRMFYVNTDGELLVSFHRAGQRIYAWDTRLKQTLVPHNFFTALEGSASNASPFL